MKGSCGCEEEAVKLLSITKIFLAQYDVIEDICEKEVKRKVQHWKQTEEQRREMRKDQSKLK